MSTPLAQISPFPHANLSPSPSRHSPSPHSSRRSRCRRPPCRPVFSLPLYLSLAPSSHKTQKSATPLHSKPHCRSATTTAAPPQPPPCYHHRHALLPSLRLVQSQLIWNKDPENTNWRMTSSTSDLFSWWAGPRPPAMGWAGLRILQPVNA